jgi:ABC-type nitrate/sulfonate/bicarbonate transport system substrate-binding protein
LAAVPELQWSIQVENKEFLKNEPGTVESFLRASRKASRYLAAHPAEWAHFNARLFGLDLALAAKSIERERPTLHFDGELHWAGLRNAIKLQHRLGAIREPLSPAYFVAEGLRPAASEVAEDSAAA